MSPPCHLTPLRSPRRCSYAYYVTTVPPHPSQKPKKMQLKLDFYKEIDPNRSTWSLASVGRLSITLAKVEHQAWPQLISKSATKPKNMHAWYDRQTVLDEQAGPAPMRMYSVHGGVRLNGYRCAVHSVPDVPALCVCVCVCVCRAVRISSRGLAVGIRRAHAGSTCDA